MRIARIARYIVAVAAVAGCSVDIDLSWGSDGGLAPAQGDPQSDPKRDPEPTRRARFAAKPAPAPKRASKRTRRADRLWPRQPGAKWPASCLIENVGVHPEFGWLTAACTDGEGERGAVLVFDPHRAELRTATEYGGFVGWDDDRQIRWHPDGKRVTTNVDTNGIAVLERGAFLHEQGMHPDDGRDHGVSFAWAGEFLCADVGTFADPRKPKFFDLETVTSLWLVGQAGGHRAGWIGSRAGCESTRNQFSGSNGSAPRPTSRGLLPRFASLAVARDPPGTTRLGVLSAMRHS